MKLKSNLAWLAFTLVSCASTPLRLGTLSISSFEKVKIDVDEQTVIGALGKPTETRNDFKGRDDEVWIYDDKSGSQRGAVAFDSVGKTVTGVTFIPREGEAEARIEYLLETKFKGLTFARAPVQRCGRHYVPHQAYYIDVKAGVILIAHKYSGEVESFSRSTPDFAADLLQRIRNCKR